MSIYIYEALGSNILTCLMVLSHSKNHTLETKKPRIDKFDLMSIMFNIMLIKECLVKLNIDRMISQVEFKLNYF